MVQINENFLKFPGSYLFKTIAEKVSAYSQANPNADIIRLGIGDVTQPLAPAVIKALHDAVDEQATGDGFRGYAPDGGYDFLREKIAEHDFKARGCQIEADEIFVSDGAKSDSANIQEIFGLNCKVAVGDPVYPVYVDSNVMVGRSGDYDETTGMWSNLVYLKADASNNFIPSLPVEKVDLIYLCYPNNPTGTTLTKSELQEWVDYANQNGAVIIYDAAYEAYISRPEVPHSIYECDGAETCAIELRSFSKKAGFTGLRLGYTVVPKALVVNGTSVHGLWSRRQSAKFNGAPYIVQRAGEAIYSPEGQAQVTEQIAYYMHNAKLIREGLIQAGFEVYGGIDAPYIWLKVPTGMDSWGFFDYLLNEVEIVGTPGAGFGPCGEGYFRLTAFGTRENTERAIERIKSLKSN